MVNLRSLYKEYECKINLKQLDETKVTEQNTSDKHPKDPGIEQFCKIENSWPVEFLPNTKYTSNDTDKHMEMIEKHKNTDICKEKTSKLVKILTQIDLLLIRAVTAEDLISYEGDPTALALVHILNKNNALQVFISKNFTKRQIFSLLKSALKLQNYNLVSVLIKSLKSMRLSVKKLEKLVFYKEFLKRQDSGIFPFDWMLQDCEDSNLNISSEIASLRFCKIIEKLKQMKDLKYDFKVSEKNIHLMYKTLWNTVQMNGHEGVVDKKETGKNYFIIL